jgi:hypothetical protein
MTSRLASPIAARRIHAVCVVACLLAVAGPPATAQDSPSQPVRSADCLPRASRVKESCDPKQVVVRIEREVEFSLDAPPSKDVQCVATMEIAYTQRDTSVAVEGTIANNVCAASSGDYKLVVSVRSANDVLQRLEFFESWQRQDEQPVKFAAAYPIGEDVDLVRVRPVQLRCTCAGVPAIE